ncbi:MAG: XRE family transcriptional regulator [Hyphomicrobiaceae bacterium]
MAEDTPIDDEQLGARIRLERESRKWSLSDLAERSGVSRAMINKVERGESSPTAALLGKLSGAFGLTLSTLLARVEASRGGRVARAKSQASWRDPETGYVRRQIAPIPGSDLPLDIVCVELPAGKSIAYPASAFSFIRQLVYVLDGELSFTEGDQAHELGAGDCIELGPPANCTFRNARRSTCTYLVIVLRK